MKTCLRCGASLAAFAIVEGIADCGAMIVKWNGRWRQFRGDACKLHRDIGVSYRRTEAAERIWNSRPLESLTILQKPVERTIRKRKGRRGIVVTHCEDCGDVWNGFKVSPPRNCGLCGGKLTVVSR